VLTILVTDMLISMLNICSKEELEEEMAYQPPSNVAAEGGYTPEEREARRQIIKNKILAIGRLSRVFAVLREESESVSELRRVSGNVRLPAGTLMLGAEGIKKGIREALNLTNSEQRLEVLRRLATLIFRTKDFRPHAQRSMR
jgi:hypothetical protein